MRMQISANIGFVTNSSHAVNYFSRQLLDHPKVKAFMERYEITEGFTGANVNRRDLCSSVLLTEEDVNKFNEELKKHYDEYPEDALPSHIKYNPEKIVVTYGDEYLSIASELAWILKNASDTSELEFETDYLH